MISETPKPPYYAVIFTSLLTDDYDGYETVAENMVNLAAEQPGFLGIESARETLGISVSYWKDLESIRLWKTQVDHQQAQQLGKEKWYSHYKVRISKVERDYEMS